MGCIPQFRDRNDHNKNWKVQTVSFFRFIFKLVFSQVACLHFMDIYILSDIQREKLPCFQKINDQNFMQTI